MFGKICALAICLSASASSPAIARVKPPTVTLPPTVQPPPITFSRPAPAPFFEAYGEWGVTRMSDRVYLASTKNNASSAFGSFCDQTGCLAFFNPAIGCDEGSSYPALISTPAGAFSVDLKCIHAGELNLYTMPMDVTIADAMSIGGVLGVAFPMASGEFKVARFSLTGAARATARASQLAQAPARNDRKNASDNLTL